MQTNGTCIRRVCACSTPKNPKYWPLQWCSDRPSPSRLPLLMNCHQASSRDEEAERKAAPVHIFAVLRPQKKYCRAVLYALQHVLLCTRHILHRILNSRRSLNVDPKGPKGWLCIGLVFWARFKHFSEAKLASGYLS